MILLALLGCATKHLVVSMETLPGERCSRVVAGYQRKLGEQVEASEMSCAGEVGYVVAPSGRRFRIPLGVRSDRSGPEELPVAGDRVVRRDLVLGAPDAPGRRPIWQIEVEREEGEDLAAFAFSRRYFVLFEFGVATLRDGEEPWRPDTPGFWGEGLCDDVTPSPDADRRQLVSLRLRSTDGERAIDVRTVCGEAGPGRFAADLSEWGRRPFEVELRVAGHDDRRFTVFPDSEDNYTLVHVVFPHPGE